MKILIALLLTLTLSCSMPKEEEEKETAEWVEQPPSQEEEDFIDSLINDYDEDSELFDDDTD